METELHNCRICRSTDLHEVINLGKQIITSRFPVLGDNSTPSALIRLVMCSNCKLVQLKDTTPSSEMYEHMYGYRSGISNTMRNHLKQYNDEIQKLITLNSGDYVLDIGSNDSTFLKYYPETINRVGCDPTGSQFLEYYDNVSLIPTYFTEDAIVDKYASNKFKVVSSISMFYDLPDPVKFAKDIYNILDDNGIWTLEQSYVLTMLEKNSIDTICHEHLEYYGLKQIKEIMDRSNFKIINVSKNNCNGGSFRIYVCKKENIIFEECTTLINEYLTNEDNAKIHTYERYIKFYNDCLKETNKLKNFLNIVNNDNKQVYIYGASTKGNCLLQFGNITSSDIKYAVERNPLKIGRMTSTGIEIISEEVMRANPPEYLLVLPWHFKDEIIERESEYLKNGGKLVFPFPYFDIYSKKPSCIITGIEGQIANYVVKEFDTHYDIVGITKKIQLHNSILKVENNLCNKNDIEDLFSIFNPSMIIHLASSTNIEECESNPVMTTLVNGVVVSYLCDIILKLNSNCKLFNASSSENYKGHTEYTITDDDVYFKPTNMYGIAKSLGHQIVDYYRKVHRLKTYNGILFTTESPLRKNIFLLKKISEHAKKWHETFEVLNLGGLDSFRNITHASDTAKAIYTIMSQDTGDTYVICSDNFIKIEELVRKIYIAHNIELDKVDNIFIDKLTRKPVLNIGNSLRGHITAINGIPTKLKNLGWTAKCSIDDIINDFK
jgi:GDP-D-mannose dehydratase